MTDTQDTSEVREAEWLRAGRLLYTLTQVGWRKGEPVMANRIMVRVDGDGRYVEDAELDALTDRLLAAITPPAREGHAELVEALKAACSISTESHLRGARLVLGFDKAKDADIAVDAIIKAVRS